MAAPGTVTLAAMRAMAQSQSDMINSNFISTAEWNSWISNSYKELYDLLVGAYGSDYFVATSFTFTTDGTNQLFSLPTDFYKLLGVDLQLSAASGSNVTLRPFKFSDRNRYAVPNFQSFYGVTNLRYRLQGSKIWLTPTPTAGQTIVLWYVPEPVDLQIEVLATYTSGSPNITVADTSLLSAGMNVASFLPLQGIPSAATISSITNSTTFVLSANATANGTNVDLRAWSDATTIDGISGWEEYIEVDCAAKALDKEESDPSTKLIRKQALKDRLTSMAAERDIGSPAVVSDSQTADTWFPAGEAGGYGSGVY